MKGLIVKNLRKEKGLTQEELAKVLDISKSTIGMIESEKREGSREVENKIANYFGVSLDYLAGKTNQKTFGITEKKKQLVSDLLEHLVSTGVIENVNNIPEEIESMILNAVKTELALIKARKNK